MVKLSTSSKEVFLLPGLWCSGLEIVLKSLKHLKKWNNWPALCRIRVVFILSLLLQVWELRTGINMRRVLYLVLTRGSTDAHIARAALESIAFQTMDILKAMEADSGISIKELRVDGGATVNNLLMQFQADVLNTVTVRPKIVETTVMGAAFLAGLAVGYWDNLEQIQEIWQTDVHFNPTTDRVSINKQIDGWYKAIEALEFWTK